jgi:hypothetical protein
MFTFMRIIEILNIILNKFNKDCDIQLLNIVNGGKMKSRILSMIILITFLCFNIVTFYSYMIALSIALNDPNNFIYPVFLKMNFVEMKKSGKAQKGKKIFEIIANSKIKLN